MLFARTRAKERPGVVRGMQRPGQDRPARDIPALAKNRKPVRTRARPSQSNPRPNPRSVPGPAKASCPWQAQPWSAWTNLDQSGPVGARARPVSTSPSQSQGPTTARPVPARASLCQPGQCKAIIREVPGGILKEPGRYNSEPDKVGMPRAMVGTRDLPGQAT